MKKQPYGARRPGAAAALLAVSGALASTQAAAQTPATPAAESVVVTGTRIGITPAGLAQQVTVIIVPSADLTWPGWAGAFQARKGRGTGAARRDTSPAGVDSKRTFAPQSR